MQIEHQLRVAAAASASAAALEIADSALEILKQQGKVDGSPVLFGEWLYTVATLKRAPQFSFKEWFRAVNVIGRAIFGVPFSSMSDGAWYDYYDDGLNPPEAVSSYIDDGGDADNLMGVLAQVAQEVVGDWIIIGSKLQALIDAAYCGVKADNVHYVNLDTWMYAVRDLWNGLHGEDDAFVEGARGYAEMEAYAISGMLAVEALCHYIYGRCMRGTLSPKETAKYLNALKAGIFDIPGYADYRYYSSVADRDYQAHILARQVALH